METFDRITIDPAKVNGQPSIRGMRITVRRVLDILATYPNRDEIRQHHPELEDEDIRQALAYAAVNREQVESDFNVDALKRMAKGEVINADDLPLRSRPQPTHRAHAKIDFPVKRHM